MTDTVDNVPPTITSIGNLPAIVPAGPRIVTVTFSEPVTGLTRDSIDISNATGSLWSNPSSADGGRTWSFEWAPRPDSRGHKSISVNLANVRDLAGNAADVNDPNRTKTFELDALRFTLDNLNIPDERLTAGETITLTFTFNRVVIGFDISKVRFTDNTGHNIGHNIGQLGPLVPQPGAEGRVWTATFTPTADLNRTEVRMHVDYGGMTDQAGNTVNGISMPYPYTVDTKVFAIREATVNRDQLVLRYSDETRLDGDETHAAPANAFTVLVDGARINVRAVTVNATTKTITLALASAVSVGQSVTVAYTDPTTGDDIHAVQEATTANGDRNNDAASFTARPVTNLTPAPPLPPTGQDSDRDGLSNALEDQAPALLRPDGSAGLAGDGNGDGVKDYLQTAVASTSSLTLVAGSRDGQLIDDSNARVAQLERQQTPATLPKGMEMPIGLTQFTVALAEGRSTESFSLYVDPVTGANGYWVRDEAGTWVNLASEPYGGKMVNEGGRLRLDFQIRDGGPYDADGQENSSVTVPGAAAKMPLSIVGQPSHAESLAFWF